MMRILACAVLLALAVPAGAAPARLQIEANPLDGRVAVLENGLIEARIAPELGGRLLAVGRAGAASLVRCEADYSQTKESVWTRGSSASLSDAPAAAWSGDSGIVRCESTRTLGQAQVQAIREWAVLPGVPALFFRVTLRNVGPAPASGVGYSLVPHFAVDDTWTLDADETLDAARLRDSKTNVTLAPRRLHAGTTDLLFDFPGAAFRLHGGGFQFRLDHSFAAGDLAPGAERTFTGAWRLLPAGAQRSGDAVPDWPAMRATAAIEPLVVPDTPPADLPRTPGLGDRYFGLCGGDGPGDFPLWQAAGVRWLRAGFGWGRGEPEPGRFDFDAMDATVAAAEDAGIALVGLIHGAPGWATRDGKSISPPRDLARWSRYVETVARRYRGRVNAWEIWNEPDIGEFWSGTVGDYAALLRAAYEGAKRGNPGCRVMSAGLDGPGERFLVELGRRGALQYCDLVGFHPYASTPAGAEKRLRTVWRILNYYRVRKPVWVTEVGWQSGGWPGGPGVVESEERKADYLAEAYALLRPLAEGVAWYVAEEPGRMYGLVQPRDGGLLLNPAYLSYRRAARAGQKSGWGITGPGAVAAQAGVPATATWQVMNADAAPLDLRVSLHEAPAWARIEAPGRVAPGETASVKIAFLPPGHAVAGTLPCVLVARTPRGPAAAAAFDLKVANPGRSCAVEIRKQWAMPLDEKGAEAGRWTRLEELVTPPGGRRRQALLVVNRGSATETFRVAATGPAGAWAEAIAPEVSVPAGKEQWIGISVRVPERTGQGTYPLVVKAICKQHADVSAEAVFAVQVGQPARPGTAAE